MIIKSIVSKIQNKTKKDNKMDNNKQYKVSILSSGDLNDKNTFEKHSETILKFLTENIPKHSEVTIGNIKNGTLIEFLKNTSFLVKGLK